MSNNPNPMKSTILSRIPSVVLILFALPFGARADDTPRGMDSRINVEFIQPENFTDIRDRFSGATDSEREFILSEFRSYLQTRGNRMLREGLQLNIRITDIDLAGEFEPWHGPDFDDVRIVKEIYPPRINLEFVLTDSMGSVLKEGKRSLVDLAFPIGQSAFTQDPLRYEKELLREWYSNEFRDFRKSGEGT